MSKLLLSDVLKRTFGLKKGITFINSSLQSEFISYERLYENALGILYNLRQNGIKEGDEIILQVEDNRTFILLFWACILGKIAPAPLSIGSQKDQKLKVIKVWKKLVNPYIIFDSVNLNRFQNSGIEDVDKVVYSEVIQKSLVAESLSDIVSTGSESFTSQADLAYIQFSSGSTGRPKGVKLSHSNLITNISDIASRSQMFEDDTSLSWVPLTHDMGLICFHLTSVFAKINQYILPTSLFIRNPLFWIDKASEKSATILYSPNFGYQYFLSAFDGRHTGWDLSSVRIIFNGAELISEDLSKRFLSAMKPFGLRKQVMYPGYGLAEASVAVSLPNPTEISPSYTVHRERLNIGDEVVQLRSNDKRGLKLMSVGFPIDNCDVRICDEGDTPFAENIVGHIQIRGGNVTAGYYNDEKQTINAFTEDGWLKTGDIGFIKEGRLVIAGRSKNIIIINGQNYYPHDIENVVGKINGIGVEKVVACSVRKQSAVSDDLIIFILYKGKLEKFMPLAKQVKEAVMEAFGIVVQNVTPIRKIPKTTSGKVQNFQLAKGYEQGKFDGVIDDIDRLSDSISSTDLSLTTSLQKLVGNFLGLKTVGPYENFHKLGLQSIQIIYLANQIKELFHVELTLIDILRNPTIKKLARCIEDSPIESESNLLPAPANEFYTVTPEQKRFWLLHQYQEHKSACNISASFKLKGTFDKNALERSFQLLISRHESLRTLFISVDGQLKQTTLQDAPFKLVEYTLGNWNEQQIETILNKESNKEFEFDQAPLLRVVLIGINDKEHILLIVIHHIIGDGWSLETLFDQLNFHYTNIINGYDKNTITLKVQHKDYAEWLNSQLVSDKLKESEKFWTERLSGKLPQLQLPAYISGIRSNANPGKVKRFEIPEKIVNGLKQLSGDHNATLFVSLLGVTYNLFYKYTDQTDIILGVTLADREIDNLKDQIGCFIHTVPIRVSFSETDSFNRMISLIKNELLNAYQHKRYPVENLADKLKSAGDYGRSPLYNVLAIMQSKSEGELLTNLGNDITATPIKVDVNGALIDLQIEFVQSPDRKGATLIIKYNEVLFEGAQINRMIAHFIRIAEDALSDPNKQIQDLVILPEDEELSLYKFNKTETQRNAEINIVHLFERQVDQFPENTAVVFGDSRITYQKLNNRSNSLAHYLIEELRMNAGDKIALVAGRSDLAIISMLAILKAGCVYTPIDAEQPLERIIYMIEDSGAKLTLTTDDRYLQTSSRVNDVINVKSNSFDRFSDDNPQKSHQNDLAYVMYTSGSTGKPKGVIIDQNALTDYARTFIEYFKLSCDDNVIQQSSLSFDTHIEEIYPILAVGGKLIVVKKGGRDIKALMKTIEKEGATILSATPSVIREINNSNTYLTDLRAIISGGDMLRPADIDRLFGKVELYNTYGPTETTVCASYHHIKTLSHASNIGKPIANKQIYIFNKKMQPVPIGVSGELYIGGSGVAQGYINGEATSEKFVEVPFAGGKRMYRTGDVGRWTEEGSIELQGRNDHQVNINGYRIETVEVENAILEYPGINDAAVIADKQNGRVYLIAVYTSAYDIDDYVIREFLVEKLPFYMLPSYFVRSESIPLNLNGKADYKKLKNNLLLSEACDAIDEPADDMEKRLIQIYEEALGETPLNVNDNFFALGGNSIKAIKLISAVHKTFGVKLDVKYVFLYPSIHGFANKIRKSSTTEAYKSLQSTAVEPFYPLSHAQKRLWVLHQLEQDLIAYNIVLARKLYGKLDLAAFEKAIINIVERHDILRTIFISIDDDPQQVVKNFDDFNFKCDVTDLSGDPESEIKVKNSIAAASKEPFDLSNGPLWRICLFKLAEKKWVFFLNIHHIISDGWSINVFADELSDFYNFHKTGRGKIPEPLNIQYKDYTHWQKSLVNNTEIAQRYLSYWKNKLDHSSSISLPTDFPRPAFKTYTGDTLLFTIDPEICKKLRLFNKVHGSTMFMTLLACVKALFYRYTGSEDIVFGTATAGRTDRSLEEQMGFYLNLLALRTKFNGKESFKDLLEKVKTTTLEAYESQIYPFDLLVEKLDVKRDMSRSALFDIMVGFQNITIADDKLNDMDGITCSSFEFPRSISQFDLSIDFFERSGDRIEGLVEFNTDLFISSRILNLIDHFKNLLTEVLNNENIDLSDIKYLSEEELKDFVYKPTGNLNNIVFKTIQEQFEYQASLNKYKIAAISENKKLSYHELNKKANQLALFLIDCHRIGRGDLVGLMIERSEFMLIAVLGILKSGSAFVPIDPEYPGDRVRHILDDGKVKLLITDQREIDIPLENINVVYTDKALEAIKGYCTDNLPCQNQSHDLAYVIYTSGTTGKPKGVMVEHRNVLSIAESWRESYKLGAFPVRLLQMASISFDVFCGDLCRSLLQGGQLIICPSLIKADPEGLYAIMKLHKVNIVESTPSVILPLMDYVFERGLNISFLKVLILGSDICLMEEFRLLNARFGNQIRIINSYGATEATIDSSFYEYKDEDLPFSSIAPIGKPFGNTRLLILDEFRNPVPAGIPGELYIGGEGVARGYLSDSPLTSAKFINHPLLKNERLYKTGDSAKWLPYGDVAFLGRNDTQIKIRGNRIELGEIENLLLSHDTVKEAIVSAQKFDDGQPFLVAYYTSDVKCSSGDLRNYLRDFLPDFMTPSYYVQVTRFKLTPNGKVDRKTLPPVSVEDIRKKQIYVAPTNDVERTLADIWEKVLQRKNIGISTPFLEAGGHSLKATQVASHINKTLGINVRLRDIFTHTTIQDLAKFIEQAEQSRRRETYCTDNSGIYDLSTAQRGLWYIEQLDENQAAYNMPDAYHLKGKLNIELFTKAFKTIIERHDSLRTAIVIIDGEPRQYVHGRCEFDIGYLDSRAVDFKEASINERIEEVILTKFDLAKPPLLRSELLQIDEDSFIFIFSIHHIIADGWSADILIREITLLYNAYNSGNPSPLKPLRFQYKDFVAWQKINIENESLEKSRQFWLNKLVTPLPSIILPLDFPRPSIKGYKGCRIERIIDQSTISKIKTLGLENGASLFMMLIATIKVLLYKFSGQTDIIIGSPVAGRENPEFESIIGFFVNTLPIRTTFKEEDSFLALLNRIRQNILEAFDHQTYPIDYMIEDVKLQRDLSRSPLFDVMVVLQNTNLEEASLDELQNIKVNNYRIESRASKFDLTFDFTEVDSGMRLEVEYNTSLFLSRTIESMLDSYERILTSITKNNKVKLNELDYISPERRRRILQQFNNTEGYCQRDVGIPLLFENQVAHTPDAIALIEDGKALTYLELNRQANKLAHYLHDQFDIRPGDMVGLFLDKSHLMAVGILGILKAGGAYVPFDSNSPRQRTRYIIEDSKIKGIITQAGLLDKVEFDRIIDVEHNAIARQRSDNLNISISGDDLIYAIYTSGTTGKPKGVLIEHKSIINLTTWLVRFVYAGASKPMTAMLTASVNFDASVQQLFAPLLCGSKLIILPESVKKDPVLFVDALYDHQVEVIDATPSYLQIILEEMITRREKPPLKYTLVGGEPLSEKTVNLYRNFFGNSSNLINVYGVTECAVDSTYAKISSGNDVQSIGRPILNTRIYILDRYLNIVAPNVSGELYIGGLGVGRGYVGLRELTAAKYISSPFVKGDRLYKTGDWAKWTEDGEIIFLGRNDDQVKIRGYRIELQEIEAALNGHTKISDSRVLTKQDEAGDKYLAAFIILKEEEPTAQIANYLKKLLPEYMIPRQFVKVEAFPLSVNGKLDKASLLSLTPDVPPCNNKYSGPGNETETILIDIWEKVFGAQGIGIFDNFFDLGGHSLKAAQILFHVHRDLATRITLKDIFLNPILKDLSKRIIKEKNGSRQFEDIPVVKEKESYELSHAQRRLWILNEIIDKPAAYNICSSYYVEGNLDLVTFENSIGILVARHESLRTRFKVVKGEPRQIILSKEDVNFKIKHFDLNNDDLWSDLVERLIAEESAVRFNLKEDLLFKVNSYKVGEGKYVLFFKLHHIIADEWSSRIIADELIEIYESLVKRDEIELPNLRVQYKDFSEWQNKLIRDGRLHEERNFWLNHIGRRIDELNFPTDFPRTSFSSNNGETVALTIEDGLYSNLTRCGKKYNTSLFNIFLACIKALLYRYTGNEDIIVGFPNTGRNHHDLENQIGFYTNIVAVRTQLKGSDSYLGLLGRVKDSMTLALENQSYPFDSLLADLNVKWESGRNPLFDIAVVFQTEQQIFMMNDIKIETFDVGYSDAKFDLSIAIVQGKEQIVIKCTYRKDLFRKDSLQMFLKRLETICREIAQDQNIALDDLGLDEDCKDLKEVDKNEFFDFSF